MVILTTTGRQYAENAAGRGPEYSVCSCLYETGGGMEVEEIMDATHMDVDKARMVLGDLKRKGYIKET